MASEVGVEEDEGEEEGEAEADSPKPNGWHVHLTSMTLT